MRKNKVKTLWLEGNESLKRTLEFLVRLLVLSLPLYLVLNFGVSLESLQVAVASQANFALTGLGYHVVQEGALVLATKGTESFQFIISPDSTAWKSMLFLSSMVVAVPGVSWKRRAVGIGLGVLLTWVFNLARVVSIVLIENAYGVETAMSVHDFWWRAGLVGFALGFWVWWMRTAKMDSYQQKRT